MGSRPYRERNQTKNKFEEIIFEKNPYQITKFNKKS